jgi:hypothetical protein
MSATSTAGPLIFPSQLTSGTRLAPKVMQPLPPSTSSFTIGMTHHIAYHYSSINHPSATPTLLGVCSERVIIGNEIGKDFVCKTSHDSWLTVQTAVLQCRAAFTVHHFKASVPFPRIKLSQGTPFPPCLILESIPKRVQCPPVAQ